MRHQHHRPDGESLHSPVRAFADGAGLSAPQMDAASTGASGQGPRDNGKADTAIVADLDAERKAFATLQARLALAGWALLQNDSSGGASQFLATRWGHARDLRDLAAVEAFARQVGAQC